MNSLDSNLNGKGGFVSIFTTYINKLGCGR